MSIVCCKWLAHAHADNVNNLNTFLEKVPFSWNEFGVLCWKEDRPRNCPLESIRLSLQGIKKRCLVKSDEWMASFCIAGMYTLNQNDFFVFHNFSLVISIYCLGENHGSESEIRNIWIFHISGFTDKDLPTKYPASCSPSIAEGMLGRPVKSKR